MSTVKISLAAFAACAAWMAYTGSGSIETISAQGKVANPITGEGLPNPAPKVTRNWGELPAGRKWGTSAGTRHRSEGRATSGATSAAAPGTAGGGPVDCDNNPVDPIFKFDRRTGKVLANFGKGVMVTPHGIHVDAQGNVWIADFAGNKAGHQGTPGPQVQPEGREASQPRHRRQAGQRRRPVQPAQRRGGRTRRQHLRLRRTRRPGDDHRRRRSTEGLKRGATARISKFSPDGKFIKSWGKLGVRHGEFRTPHALVFDANAARRVPDAARHGVRFERPSLGRRSRQPPHRDLRPGRQIPRVALHVRTRQRDLHQGRHWSTRSTRSRVR